MSVFFEAAAAAKRVLRPLLSERAVGAIQQTLGIVDCIRCPERAAGWGPFNGQTARQALFVEIIANIRPHAIVETRTFLGMTTELMCQTGLPLFTIESNPRNYGFARPRRWHRRNVPLFHGDSRGGLRRLFDGPLHALSGRTVFFYLDAHRNDDL